MLLKKNTQFILQTWHKIFHSFTICVPRMRCANCGAMKNCCLALVLALSLAFFVPFNAHAATQQTFYFTITYKTTSIFHFPTDNTHYRVWSEFNFPFSSFAIGLNDLAQGRNQVKPPRYTVHSIISSNNRYRFFSSDKTSTWMDSPPYTSWRINFVHSSTVPSTVTNIQTSPTFGKLFDNSSVWVLNLEDYDYPYTDIYTHIAPTVPFVDGYAWGFDGIHYDSLERESHIAIRISTDYFLGTSEDILGSVSEGFNTVHSDLLSIRGSINSGFSNVQQSISNQTDSINSGFSNVQQSISNQTDSINLNQDANTQKILDQNSQFRQEDRQEAQSVGTIAQDFLTQNTAKVRSNFNILWEPIAFTQRVISVFSGGTKSSLYARRYDGVVGFVYNEQTGCLDPVIDTGPRARYGKASSGTTITFPAYTLPVLNLKLWDSYTFDVATVKSAFPVLFNAIYVFSGVLCLYWFLGFLSDKFQEVFKE